MLYVGGNQLDQLIWTGVGNERGKEEKRVTLETLSLIIEPRD
jgi:hypothetical protein